MDQTTGLSRRRFLKRAGAAAATTLLAPHLARAANPSEKIRLALIGCGGMGNRHLDSLVANDRCEVVAVCDVWKRRYEASADKVESVYGHRPEGYQDYRRILERDDIDAVFSATPDHWHALIAIHACEAGKDVYTEKPVATTISEGRAMVEAARRYGRVMQVGTQQRSQDLFHEAVDIVQSGRLGQVTTAGAWVGVNNPYSFETITEPPEDLDWDLWLGPAPYRPYSPQRHGGFRAFHDYARGELTNWGVHLLDVVHWGIGHDAPLTVKASGGSYRQLSGGDDPEVVHAVMEYPGCQVVWDQRHGHMPEGKGYGMRFHGTAGRLVMDRGSFVVLPPEIGIEETFEQGDPWIDVVNHHNDFFDCIASRRLPAADIEQAHRSTVPTLLAAIACDVGRTLRWDRETERIIGDEQANRHLVRPYRAPWHL
jgi:predicted dehydrogenase